MATAHAIDARAADQPVAGSGAPPSAATERGARPIAPQPAPPRRPIPAPVRLSRPGGARAELWVRLTIALVVAALLAFAFATPIPGPTRHAAQAERRLVEVRALLAEMRAVLTDYHADHGLWPGQRPGGRAAPDLFEGQIVQTTDSDGAIDQGPPGRRRAHRLGPYREEGVPRNPATGLASVGFLRAEEPWPAAADGSTGWLYRPSTGEIRANAPGRAFTGAPRFFDL